MGVTNLWSLVAASSRPTPLPTLNHRRLAIDASIWIYQFLKAVRDKEGNALRNAHVVGFFRRICKLLFHGIRPVFVFDGGAPALKRATIAGRKRRREGRREVGRQVAARLLGIQLLRRAEEEKERQRERARGPAVEGERQDGEEQIQETDLVYVEELGMDKAERERKRGFKKKDAYHLPDLKSGGLSAMGQPDDPRIMSQEELEEYARQFESGEDINLYDFSKIDFDSPFFMSLPAADRYNILNAARLRSRLRMGYSKEQLEEMFPDRMAFSRFQIERVTERNELTQRLMNLNGMNGGDGGLAANSVGRVAGERGREYVLVKNDGVDGGWALGVVTKKDEGARSKPIDVDEEKAPSEDEVEEEDENEIGAFEDIPIEGLNRLPKITARVEIPGLDADERRRVLEQRRALYLSRKETMKPGKRRPKVPKNPDPDSLFITEDLAESEVDSIDDEADDLFEDVEATHVNDSDEDLDRAIAMSLQQETNDTEDEYQRLTIEEIQQTKADETMSFKKGSGRMIAHIANNRANAAALKAAQQKAEASETLYIQSASERAPLGRSHILETPRNFNLTSQKEAEKTAQMKGAFGGPLPFEKLDFSKSLLGAKKKKGDADEAGGFERKPDSDTTAKKKEQPQEAPPWFDSDAARDVKTQEDLERRQREDDKLKAEQEAEQGRLKALKDVEARRVLHRHAINDVVEVDASDDGHDSDVQMIQADDLAEKTDAPKNDMADLVRAEPTAISEVISMEIEVLPQYQQNEEQVIEAEELIEWEDSDVDERFLRKKPKATVKSPPTADEEKIPTMLNEPESTPKSNEAIQDQGLKSTSRSASPTFEDVIPEGALSPVLAIEPGEAVKFPTVPTPPASAVQAILPIADPFDDAPALEYDDESDYSDPEDATLLASLTAEATEHARFAASLNPTAAKQTASSYESDLRALRTQQAATRRDADEVSHIMVTECQQLLSLFGLPYITAPMEAEAQCAELVRLGLVDGIVTDDSDCFLFGGTRIYKNMFNQAKFVECYLAADLEREFDLTREKLIRIAHLLGSDYTEGIPGVGPVTALEIVGEFEQLEDFREWLQGVQEGTRLTEGDRGSAWRKKFRRKAAGMFLPPGFPSEAVTKAYLQPEVDSSPVPFQWGVPDLDELRGFLMRTIGWTQERTDEILVPVIKDMNRRVVEGTQSNITGFFGGTVGVGVRAAREKDGRGERRGGKAGSRRMEGALGRLREGAKRKRNETREIVENTNANDTQQEEVLVAEVAAKVPKKAKRVTQAKVKTTRRPAFASDSDSNDERRVLED